MSGTPAGARRLEHVVVTGATGFIGRALCAALSADGVTVTAVARRRVDGPWTRLVTLNLGSEPLADDMLAGVDTVFHLAARVHALDELRPAAQVYQRDNVEATRAIVESAVRSGVGRLVNFSSVKASGEGGAEPADEDQHPRPLTEYGRSKLEAERLVAAAAAPGFQTVSLRLPMVYGPGGRGNLTRMMAAMASGRFPPLPDTGNRRSMVHVGNVVEAARLVAVHRAAAAGQTYIVTDGTDYSTARLQTVMREVLGLPQPRWHVPNWLLRTLAVAGDAAGRALGRRVGFDSDALDKLLGSACYRSDRLVTELGFRARFGLDDGLRTMWEEVARDPSQQAGGARSGTRREPAPASRTDSGRTER